MRWQIKGERVSTLKHEKEKVESMEKRVEHKREVKEDLTHTHNGNPKGEKTEDGQKQYLKM